MRQMSRLIDLVDALRAEAPAIAETKEWKILKEVASSSMADILIPTVMEAERVVEWREKPCTLLSVNDERINLDEMYASFNDRLPMGVIAIITKDDWKPSDLPHRQVREAVNAWIIEHGMDKPNHE